MLNGTKSNFAATQRRGGRAAAGFTLVELLIVFAILAIIAGFAIPALFDAMKSARTARVIADLHTIGDGAYGYYAQYNSVPNSLADVGYNQETDPWGNHYQYLAITPTTTTQRTDRFGVPINSFFDLYSMGPDGQTSTSLHAPASQDDLVWANDGFYIGVAADY